MNFSLRKGPGGDIFFDIDDPQVNDFGVQSMVYSVPMSDEDRLSSATDFFHHLRRSNGQNLLAQDVTLEAYSLVEQEFMGQTVWRPEDTKTNRNVTVSGIMTVDVSEKNVYGFHLFNSTSDCLYAWAFLFDLSDLSIGEC